MINVPDKEMLYDEAHQTALELSLKHKGRYFNLIIVSQNEDEDMVYKLKMSNECLCDAIDCYINGIALG